MVRLSAFHYRTKVVHACTNRRSTNIGLHRQNQKNIGKTKRVGLLLLQIVFTLFTLHFVTILKKARATETASVTCMAGTRRKHRMRLVDSPPRSSVPQFLTVEREIFNRLLKKNG